ncbi:hypothetical protein R3P38DRAFT_2720656 [Favolaschia claudopus]|uniref:Uncharacterized protein n=1 Tax=Favolaschia claudopus TaxID=2862362 RepID=A0AAW0ANG0_9AGAR
MTTTVPTIRLIVPTPDVSAATYADPNASISSMTSVSVSGASRKRSKSVLGMLAGPSSAATATPYNTARGAGDFSDIVRRVGAGDVNGGGSGTSGSVTGRGWEVRVDGRRDGGTWDGLVDGNGDGEEGMVLIKKKVKTRGRVDAVFRDVSNAGTTTRPTTPVGIEGNTKQQEKEKWWNLTARGRKDTGGSGGVLAFVRRSKSPGPGAAFPVSPNDTQAVRRPQQNANAAMQMHLPGEPDCTFDMVDVPSVRGRRGRSCFVSSSYLPSQSQPFPAQKRFNSLGASSALGTSNSHHPQPHAPVYQRSVSAGSAALLTQSQSKYAQQSQSQAQSTKYAHLPGASAPYATMTRLETYQQPASPRSIPPRSPPADRQQAFPQQSQSQSQKPQYQRSASAMAFSSSSRPGYDNDDADEVRPEYKRSASAMGGALVGSGILLGAPASTLGRVPTPTPLSRAPTPVPGPRSGTPMSMSGAGGGGLLVPPGGGTGGNKDKDQGSIALRAMRSVRSMARLWDGADENKDAEGAKKGEGEGMGTVKGKKVKAKVKVKEEKVKDSKKDKAKDKVKRAPKSSGSSFEVGALGTSPVQRKRSILGLGLGSSSLSKSKSAAGTGIGMGLPSALSIGRSASGGGKASTASSVFVAPPPSSGGAATVSGGSGINPNRLSAESAFALGTGIGANLKRESTNSSLRPISVLSSSGSGTSSRSSRVSSGSSVRWAEEVVDRVRGGKGREERKDNKDKEKEKRESRRSSEGRRRTPLSDVFPGFGSRRSSASSARPESLGVGHGGPPMLTVEEATTDGHGHGGDSEEEEIGDADADADYQIVSATPVKRPRPRPVSDDMIINGGNKPRPRGIVENGADSVLNLLDAATNDLAQLITHLDLEGTPANTPSPGRVPMIPRPQWHEESPTGKGKILRPSEGSLASLRPYAARNASAQAILGQQIAPWPPASPPSVKHTPPVNDRDDGYKRTHRRTMTPSPEPEPAPVFHPLRLRPSRIRPQLALVTTSTVSSPSSSDEQQHGIDMRAPSSLTFGSRSSSSMSAEDPETLRARGLPTVFTRGHERNRSSLLPDAPPSAKSSQGSARMPLARESKRVLGMGGTMGGSDVILASSSGGHSPTDDTMSFCPPEPLPSPGLPPFAPLPAVISTTTGTPPPMQLPVLNFELIDSDHHGYMDEGALSGSEEDTKKSFDFTGELKKLNESGVSDRRSFVEQLENAFATPAKIDLRGLLCMDVPPPVPALPPTFKADMSGSSTSSSEQLSSSSGFTSSSGFEIPHSVSRLIDMKELTMGVGSSEEEDHSMDLDGESASRLIDHKEPTLLPGSDSLASDGSPLLAAPRPRHIASGPSDGQLNLRFKFGGELPEEEVEVQKPKPRPAASKKPLTLSDIIPPPAHARGQSLSFLMEEDDSVMKSILAHAENLPRPRVNSDTSIRRAALENSRMSLASMHSRTRSRPQSGISFTGLDSFEEVRRGFEFHQNRPAFYPPPVATNRRVAAPHLKQESVFSIASISSYGHVTNPGISDPFDYGLAMPSLRERPSSEDLSVSMSNFEDTFQFMRDAQPRKRVASDASSFYFNAPVPGQAAVRGHRHRESNFSVSSQGPPVSFYNYNRSYGSHRLSENDTSTSGSSLAHQYASYGANGGRAAWAKHRQESSVDSRMSDVSVARLGRPGVGEKMFMDVDYAQPLTAISASPPESHSDFRDRSSWDSIIDGERPSAEDSLFERTGHRSSMSEDSVFGYDDHHVPSGHLLPPHQFRPLSVLSFNNSTDSPPREDETMVTMLGGGHVRRRSIGYNPSPCVRVEKRKHAAFHDDEKAPNKARIISQPSIASTSSSKFGEDRMIRARQGLLERQSLEASALVAEGEDFASFRPTAVFTRPAPSPNRSRSSTITTSSSGRDTPPLSSAEGSSMSETEGSMSSIDVSHISPILCNTTHPISTADRMRARGRGHGHRRRYSAAATRASRSSVYETIQEERPSPASSIGGYKSSPTARHGIFVVDGSNAGSMDLSAGGAEWHDVLRKYYTLRNEAEDAVTESRRVWMDTPFSLYALQAFSPPKHPDGMQALLQHSVQNYGPLPMEYGPRRVRSRTQSRPSPYPQRQAAASPELLSRPSPSELHRAFVTDNALQVVDVNSSPAVEVHMSPAVLSPKRENAWGLAGKARPRVGSAARRSALGWAKRGTKTSTDQKENNTSMTSISFMMTPGESLRINRPRPRGRPTPARAGVATPRLPLAAA